MIRAILCKLILGIDPAQIQADLRNIEAHSEATRSRLAGLENRVAAADDALRGSINGRFTGRVV